MEEGEVKSASSKGGGRGRDQGRSRGGGDRSRGGGNRGGGSFHRGGGGNRGRGGSSRGSSRGGGGDRRGGGDRGFRGGSFNNQHRSSSGRSPAASAGESQRDEHENKRLKAEEISKPSSKPTGEEEESEANPGGDAPQEEVAAIDAAEDAALEAELKEEKIGVSEFIQAGGFGFKSGKLKLVPEDFFVNEIDSKGHMVELTAPFERQTTAKPVQETVAAAASAAGTDASNGYDGRISALKNELAAKQIEFTERDEKALLELLSISFQANLRAVFEKPVSDKAARGFVHQCIRKHLSPLVTSTTLEDQRISVQRANNEQIKKDVQRLRGAETRPKHVEIVLRKRNLETGHCLNELSRLSRVPRKNFAIAGTKDKRAVTTQRVGIRFVTVADLIARCSGVLTCGQKDDQTFQIGNLEETEEAGSVFLGGLKGNRFAIAIKQLECPVPLPSVDISSWSSAGFMNYFGLQRFGTASIGTHVVGVALVNRDYPRAIDLLLCPRSGEDDRLKEVRERYARTKDAAALLEGLPHRCVAERTVAEGLVQGLDPWTCLSRIPKNTLTLYLHAAQSLVWNRVATARIKACRTGPLKGDLVKDKQSGKVVRVVSDEDVGGFTLADVLLCLPGTESQFPGTDAVNASTYDALLREMGVVNGLDQFLLTSPRELSLTGSYRSLVLRPEHVEHRLVQYEDDAQIMFDSRGKFLPTVEESTGSRQALLLRFDLPSGTYATMALRELLNPGA